MLFLFFFFFGGGGSQACSSIEVQLFSTDTQRVLYTRYLQENCNRDPYHDLRYTLNPKPKTLTRVVLNYGVLGSLDTSASRFQEWQKKLRLSPRFRV